MKIFVHSCRVGALFNGAIARLVEDVKNHFIEQASLVKVLTFKSLLHALVSVLKTFVCLFFFAFFGDIGRRTEFVAIVVENRFLCFFTLYGVGEVAVGDFGVKNAEVGYVFFEKVFRFVLFQLRGDAV